MKFFAKLVFFLVLSGFGWALGFVWFYFQVPFKNVELTEKVEAVVVLTGGSRRVGEGLRLLKENKGEILMISGVNPGVTIQDLIRQEKERPEEFRQIDPRRIILGFVARDTETNAMETWAWVQQRGIKSICLVTSDYHMPRSLLEVRSILPHIKIIPHAVLPYTEKWNEKRAKLLLKEYNKYLVAFMRIKLSRE